MFDDDSKKHGYIEEYSAMLYERLGFKPTFITETPNGYQFGIILKNPIFKYHKNSEVITQEYILLQDIKKAITKKIDCDVYGSHRMIGIWRNPLQHNFTYTSKKYYINTLKNLLFLSNTFNGPALEKQLPTNRRNFPQSPDTSCCKMHLGRNTKIFKTIEKGFHEGNRNNYLFAFGFKIVFEDRSKVKSIEKELLQINRSYNNALTDYEVQNIAKSVVAYSQKMYTPQHTYSKRGKLSDEMWKIGIHGVKNRRAYAGYVTAKNRAINTTEKIINSIIEKFNKGSFSISNKEISEKIKLSQRQIQRYSKKISKSRILILWLKSLNDNRSVVNKIVIRAYVALIEKAFLNSLNSLRFVAKQSICDSFVSVSCYDP
ncbi:hypothetical protein [Sulfurimonas sp.]